MSPLNPRNFIDLHSHILPGLDDGAGTIDASIELARAFVAAGVHVVAATPHVSDRYQNRPNDILSRLQALRAALDAAEIVLEVVGGAEIEFEQLGRLRREERRSLSLGGTGRFLLVEFPSDVWPPGIAEALASLAREGMFVVLAHPERNPTVQAAPQRLTGLVEAGALVQVNAGSLVGASGTASASAARSLIETGLAQLIASDAHDPRSRPMIADAVKRLPDALAEWLTWDVPKHLLAGRRPPPRPQARIRRWFRW